MQGGNIVPENYPFSTPSVDSVSGPMYTGSQGQFKDNHICEREFKEQ